MTVTRFPNGVTNASEIAGFAELQVPDPSIYHWFFDDFDFFPPGDRWVEGGVGAPVAPALVAGDGGRLQLENSAADNDNSWIHQFQPAWTIQAGKKLFFSARVSLNAGTFGEIAVGLQVAVAGDEILEPVNGLFLRKPDGEEGMQIVNRVGGVETASVVTVPGPGFTPGVITQVFFAYDGQGNVIAGANNIAQVSITPAAFTSAALVIMMGVQNTSAAARILTVDQIFCAKER